MARMLRQVQTRAVVVLPRSDRESGIAVHMGACTTERFMHELSIAMSLVDVASEEAERRGVIVDAVHIRLGPLSGVVKEALNFSFDVAAAGSAIEGARLIIEDVPLTARCEQCDAERIIASPQHLRCPVCNTPTPEIVRGGELELFALEIRENAATHH